MESALVAEVLAPLASIELAALVKFPNGALSVDDNSGVDSKGAIAEPPEPASINSLAKVLAVVEDKLAPPLLAVFVWLLGKPGLKGMAGPAFCANDVDGSSAVAGAPTAGGFKLGNGLWAASPFSEGRLVASALFPPRTGSAESEELIAGSLGNSMVGPAPRLLVIFAAVEVAGAKSTAGNCGIESLPVVVEVEPPTEPSESLLVIAGISKSGNTSLPFWSAHVFKSSGISTSGAFMALKAP